MERATQREQSHSAIGAASRRIALVAGGTAGHVYPALAVADAYRRALPGVQALFIGTGGGFEARLVTAHGYRFETIPSAPLFGVGVVGKALAAQRLVTGIGRGRRLLRAEGIDLVIGFGGYVSASTIVAAHRLRLLTAILELNAQPGLTNRLLGRIVDRVYLGYAAAECAFAATRTMLTGVPLRPQVVRGDSSRRPGPDRAQWVHILVTGGSLGSSFLNRNAAELLGCVAAQGVGIEVLHQAGDRDLESVRQAYARVGLTARVTPYIEEIADAYAWAHFAI